MSGPGRGGPDSKPSRRNHEDVSQAYDRGRVVLDCWQRQAPHRRRMAEIGSVSVVFTKGGFIVGVGGGRGCADLPRQKLSVHGFGQERRLHVGASTTKFVGRAINLRSPSRHRRQLRRGGCRRRFGGRCRRRAVAERQWRHPAAQRAKGRRGSVSRLRRCHHHHELIRAVEGGASSGTSRFAPAIVRLPVGIPLRSGYAASVKLQFAISRRANQSPQTITMPISPGTPPGKSMM